MNWNKIKIKKEKGKHNEEVELIPYYEIITINTLENKISIDNGKKKEITYATDEEIIEIIKLIKKIKD